MMGEAIDPLIGEAIDLLVDQFIDTFHDLAKAFVVDDVIDEFSVTLGFDDTCPAQNGKVLRGNRLFQPEVNVDLGYGQFLVFVQQADDLLAQFVIEGPQDQRSLLQVQKINFYRSTIRALCVYYHPVAIIVHR
jgi:hypothetical protein